MPTEIRVRNFTSQAGQTEEAAVAALQAIDPGVLIAFNRVHDLAIASGIVISQLVENVAIESAGGPADSQGVRVTLTVSVGPGTWFASTANEAEAAKLHCNPFIAVDLDFPSGHVRVWSGWGMLTIAGNLYTGLGELGRVTNAVERTNLTTERKTYQLAGAMVNPALVSEDDIDNSFRRPVVEYLGFLDPITHQLVDEPEIRFEGEISNIRRVDGREPVIEINAEDRMAILDKADGWRYTHSHQQQFYPGDMGCEPASRLNMREILWGGHRVSAGVGSYTPPRDPRRGPVRPP